MFYHEGVKIFYLAFELNSNLKRPIGHVSEHCCFTPSAIHLSPDDCGPGVTFKAKWPVGIVKRQIFWINIFVRELLIPATSFRWTKGDCFDFEPSDSYGNLATCWHLTDGINGPRFLRRKWIFPLKLGSLRSQCLFYAIQCEKLLVGPRRLPIAFLVGASVGSRRSQLVHVCVETEVGISWIKMHAYNVCGKDTKL